MGKIKKQRTRNTKLNPLGIFSLDLADVSLQTPHSQVSGPVETIREQLQKQNIEEKLNGLQSLAVVSASDEKVAAICRSDVVRIAASLLCEPVEAVRNAAAGALRNLSVNSPEVCVFMVQQDVITPLLALLNEYTDWIPSFDASMGGQIDLRSDVFLQGINLLRNLCESTPCAVDAVNQTKLPAIFIRCIDDKKFGLDISISVAQCLLVVTENNPKLWSVINEHVSMFIYLMKTQGAYGITYLRTLSAGILSNVPALASAHECSIILALSEALEINHSEALTRILSSLYEKTANSHTSEIDMNINAVEDETEEAASIRRRRQELPTETDLAVRDVGYLLDAQRTASEIITNLCSGNDEESIISDDCNESENESVVDDEILESDIDRFSDGRDKPSMEVLEALTSTGLLDKLWLRAQPLEDNLPHQLHELSMCLFLKAKNLRISALLCLQNLCNTLDSEDLGGPTAIYNVWVNLGKHVFKGPQDLSILEPSTSLMRSALEHLKKYNDLFSEMTQNDIDLILDGVKGCTIAEIRANWLRMLGTLGCLLPETLVKVIILFIVETCAKENDVWTISEAVDALMDMFADNDWDEIIVSLNLVDTLKSLEKIFKTKMRQQRRELRNRYSAVKTVFANFQRFVKYIEKESEKNLKSVDYNS